VREHGEGSVGVKEAESDQKPEREERSVQRGRVA
jgi:hypothetical protein